MMEKYPPEELEALYNACSNTEGTPHARGAALEDFVQHVFCAVPSVKLHARDVKDEDGAQEVDLVLTHLQHLSKFPMPDVTIIIECKNEEARTTASQVRDFASKLDSRAMSIGILVTYSGLTGGTRLSAHAVIRDTLALHKVAIIVVLAHELATLSAPEDLATLLTDRLNELRTFRQYRSI